MIDGHLHVTGGHSQVKRLGSDMQFCANIANSKGKLTKVSSSVSTTEYTAFDILGRVTAHKQTTDGGQTGGYTTGYTYKLNGALDEETYPSGRVVKNVLDADGDLSIVQSKKNAASGYFNYAKNFTYNAAGAATSLQLGNGRWESTVFNSRLQPTQIALGTVQNGTDKLKLNFDYGTTANNGNIQSQTITVPGMANPLVQSYTYDSLNRLASATETSNSSQTWKQTFTFDRYGNRRFDFTGGNTTVPASNCVEATCNPTISSTNNRLTSTGYNYDAAGNTTYDAALRKFTYDAENKQTKVESTNSSQVVTGTVGEYSYDGDGKRVKKYVPGTGETTIFVYDAGGKEIAEYSTIVASVNDAKVNYLTTDHLGSPRINTDANGAIIARHDYHPFGEEINGVGGRTTGLNYGADTVRKQFTSYERDTESDLDFAQARMYGYNHGRFTSPDPYKIVAEVQYERDEEKARALLNRYVSQPQQWNQYAYAINNPVKYTDPSGEKVELTGDTAEERAAALQRLRNILGEERFKLVTVSADGRSVSLSNENVAAFQKIGDDADNRDFSLGMAEILGSKEVVEFQVTESFTNKHNKTFSTATTLIPGGITVGKEESSTGNVQIFVSPRAGEAATNFDKLDPRRRSSDGKPLLSTNAMVDAHEFGEALPKVQAAQGPAMGASPNSREPAWKTFENAIRSRNPNNSQRRAKH